MTQSVFIAQNQIAQIATQQKKVNEAQTKFQKAWMEYNSKYNEVYESIEKSGFVSVYELRGKQEKHLEELITEIETLRSYVEDPRNVINWLGDDFQKQTLQALSLASLA